MPLIAREREQALLERYFCSDKAEFLVVYGRRRVGKTFLVKEHFADRLYFYFTGIANSSISEHIERFNVALLDHGLKYGQPPNSWMTAFDCLKNAILQDGPNHKKVIFLDEMPWMDTPRSGFLKALEYFWNSFASSRKDILLIACGSAASWISKKVFRNRGGLHNRITGKLLLKPFTLRQSEEFIKSKGLVLSRYDIAEAFMVFGGVPYYLSYFEKGRSLAQNIDAMLYAEDAPLKDEFDNVFASLFKNSENYVKAVEALAAKRRGLSRHEIIATTGISDGGTISEVLDNLELSGFIRRYQVYPGKEHGALLQLIDPFSLYSQTFTKELKGNNEHFWSDVQETPRLNGWRGYAFEQLCLQHLPAIKQALGIAGVATNAFAWRSRVADPGAQIDLVVDRADRVVNICEIKFAKYEFSINKAYHNALLNKLAAFQNETKTRSNLHLAFISTFGLKHNEYSSLVQKQVVLDDLFA